MHFLKFPSKFVALVTVLSLATKAQADLFAAIADLEDLIETETILMTNIDNYITFLEEKAEFLKSKLREYQKANEEASKDIPLYVSNPINAYRLIKRLMIDGSQVERAMTYDEGLYFATNYQENIKFPDTIDLLGVLAGLSRLQMTYNLDTASLALGEINGRKYHREMTAEECFHLGKIFYQMEDYYQTGQWMIEALNRLSESPNQQISKLDIMEYLVEVSEEQNKAVDSDVVIKK
jgi:prolyl 4-hydroxylase